MMLWTASFNLLLALAGPSAVASSMPLLIAQADVIDGFVASCTGNFDGTGLCVNSETNQRFTCLIIPGQVIDCKLPSARSFQCVWVSGVQANYAEFWCDPQVDLMVRSEISSRQFDTPTNASPLGPGPSGTSFPANEIKSDRFDRDRFRPEDLKPDDPFGSSSSPGSSGPSSDASATPPADSGLVP
jgi:hypothetical protein